MSTKKNLSTTPQESKEGLPPVGGFIIMTLASAIGLLTFGAMIGLWWMAWLFVAVLFIVYWAIYKTQLRTVVALMVALIVVASLTMSFVAWTFRPLNDAGVVPIKDTASTAQSAQSSDTKAYSTVCPPQFIQNEHSLSDDPEDTRIVDGLDLETIQILERSQALPAAEAAQFVSDGTWEIMTTNLGHNYKALASAALTFGVISPEENTAEKNALLVTEQGTCLSEEGQDLLRVTLLVMERNIESVTVEEAPQGLCNSGWNNGQVVVAESCGITGNREAVVFNLQDGSRIYVLTRCGNWTFKPGGNLVTKLPPGETDNPPPPTTVGKGTTNPESQHGLWGDTSGGSAESTAPRGPSTSNGTGGWHYVPPANPQTVVIEKTPNLEAPPSEGSTDQHVPPSDGTPIVGDNEADTGIDTPPDD